jgi:hypothetical protein
MTIPVVESSQYQSKRKELSMTAPDYETEFADLPEMVGTGEAALILNLAGTTGVHYVLDNLPDDAPEIEITTIQFGKRTYNRYSKTQLIALRRYRDSKGL